MAFHMLKNANLLHNVKLNDFIKEKLDYNKRMFQDLDTMAPTLCVCEGTVMTDGVSLSIRFKVNKTKSNDNRNQISKPTSEHMIGIDPERVDIISVVDIIVSS